MDEDERDFVVFEDEDGNEITLKVLDYLNYEGRDYAMLCDPDDDDDECVAGDCETCEARGTCEVSEKRRDVYIMEVVNVGDDMEEFVEVEDGELAETILDIFQNSDFDVEDDGIDLSELLGLDDDGGEE